MRPMLPVPECQRETAHSCTADCSRRSPAEHLGVAITLPLSTDPRPAESPNISATHGAQYALIPSSGPFMDEILRSPGRIIDACIVPAATESGKPVGLGYALRHPS